MAQQTRCPTCGSTHVRRHEQIWLQGHSTVRGPRFTTTRVNDHARLYAPPAAPETSGYWYGRLAWHAALALVPLGIAWFTLAHRGSALMATTLIAIGIALVAGGWPRGRMNASHDEALTTAYNHACDQYRRQWACLACGQSFMFR